MAVRGFAPQAMQSSREVVAHGSPKIAERKAACAIDGAARLTAEFREPMILEVAVLDVKPGAEPAFERDFAVASALISSIDGYLSHELQRCLENKHRYILLARWKTLEAHTEGFRKSPQYTEWKKLLHHYYDPFPTVEHYRLVDVPTGNEHSAGVPAAVRSANAPTQAGDEVTVREFTLDHYEAVRALWEHTPGICLREADSRVAIERYLLRNPGLSFIAVAEGHIVGSALCGHDGRRGYLQHVAVAPNYRNRGIAGELVSRCVAALEREGISKVHLDVLANNEAAQAYWRRRGWQQRGDLCRFSRSPLDSPNT